jgi:hypothetical protein
VGYLDLELAEVLVDGVALDLRNTETEEQTLLIRENGATYSHQLVLMALW